VTAERPDTGGFLEWVDKAEQAGENARNDPDPQKPAPGGAACHPGGITPENVEAVQQMMALQERLFQSWWEWIPTWNHRVCRFNPTGWKFKRKQLRNMGTQFASDVTLASDSPRTADELLSLAELMESIGRGT
jgi:hypothetical protein